MLGTIIVILIILFILGYIRIPGIIIKDAVITRFNGHPITLWGIVLFFVILWAIDILPSPLREIAAMLFLLWILSTLGVLVIVGFSNILILAVIIGLVLTIFHKSA
jgi:hypothetical protein